MMRNELGRFVEGHLVPVEWIRKNSVGKICGTCGREFEVHRCRKDKAKYCSNDCYTVAKRGRKLSEETRGKIGEAQRKMVSEGRHYNPMEDPFSAEKMKETIKKQFEKGRETWNKGLTHFTNPRITAGKKHYLWKGGITEYNYPLIFRWIREKVVRRDDYACQICGAKENLIVHHLDMNKENCEMDNLVTICKSCHRGIHNIGVGG